MKNIYIFIVIITSLLTSSCMPLLQNSSEKDTTVLTIRSLTAAPSSVASGTDTEITLTWSYSEAVSQNVECVNIDTLEVVENGGAVTVNTSDSQTIGIECTDDGKAAAAFIDIPSAEAPVISKLRIFPNIMNVGTSGEAHVTWELAGSESDCTVNNAAASGRSFITQAEASDSFVLSCTNPAGTDTQTISVNSAVMSDEGVTKTAPAAGGTLTWGHVQMDIPADALDVDTEITLSASDPYEGADHLIHFPITFAPAGLQFKNPVTVTVSYDDSLFHEDINESSISMAYFDENGWRNVMTTVDTDSDTMTFMLGHFSTLAASSNPDANTQPFKTRITDLIKTEEAITMSPYRKFKYTDDGNTSYDKSDITVQNEVIDILDTTACDLDADGQEEAVMLKHTAGETVQILVGKTGTSGAFVITDNFYMSEIVAYDWQYADIACGDVDGGNDEELIVAVSDNAGHSKLFVFSLEPVNNSASHSIVNLELDDSILTTRNIRGRIKVDVGNLDDDDNLEIALLGLKYHDSGHYSVNRYERWTPTIITFDDSDAGFAKTAEITSSSSSDILATSFKKQGSVIGTRGVYQTFDTYDAINIILGNFENDDNDEIAVVGYNFPDNQTRSSGGFSSNQYIYLNYPVHKTEVFDSSPDSPSIFTVKRNLDFRHGSGFVHSGLNGYYQGNNVRQAPYDEYPLRKGDFNGDGLDEIVSVMGLSGSNSMPSNARRNMEISPMIISPVNNSLTASFRFRDVYNLIQTSAEDKTYNLYPDDSDNFTFSFHTADVDSDGFSELVTLFDTAYGYSTSVDLSYFQAVRNRNYSYSSTYYYDFTYLKYYAIKDSYYQALGNSALVVGDFDADNVKVAYTGEHRLIDIDPVPLMIVAASPNYHDSNAQTLGSSTLTNKTSTSSTNSSFKSYSMSLGYGLKFEVPEAFSTELTASIQTSSKATKGTTVLTGSGSFYQTNEDDNVVYVSSVVDSYLYEVLASPNLENITVQDDGKRYMTINLPYDHHRYMKNFSSYNANNGNAEDIIAEDFLFHTEGDPTTYPSAGQMTALIPHSNLCSSDYLPPDCYLVSEEMSTPEGSNSAFGTNLTFSQSNNFETSFEVALVLNGSTCVGSVCEKYSSSQGNGISFSFTANKNMEATGSLGALSEDIEPGTSSTYYDNRQYFANMFLYFDSLSNGNPIQILNYSVNPAWD